MKNRRITPKTVHPPKETELIHLLTTQCSSLKEAASFLNITVKETKKRLHLEFLNLRIQNNILEISHSDDGINFESLLQPI